MVLGKGEEREWSEEERMKSEQENRDRDSSEVDDGSLACSKAMGGNSSHQAAFQTQTLEADTQKHTGLADVCAQTQTPVSEGHCVSARQKHSSRERISETVGNKREHVAALPPSSSS